MNEFDVLLPCDVLDDRQVLNPLKSSLHRPKFHYYKS